MSQIAAGLKNILEMSHILQKIQFHTRGCVVLDKQQDVGVQGSALNTQTHYKTMVYFAKLAIYMHQAKKSQVTLVYGCLVTSLGVAQTLPQTLQCWACIPHTAQELKTPHQNDTEQIFGAGVIPAKLRPE